MRERLPNRRYGEIVEFDYTDPAGTVWPYTAGVGRFSDGRVAEVFLNGGKVNSFTEIVARDSAVVLSIALQHGVPLETIAEALLRDDYGRAAGPLGTLIDQLRTSSALTTVEAPPAAPELTTTITPSEVASVEKVGHMLKKPPSPAAARAYREQALAMGYTGDACGQCGNFTLTRNGTCLKCMTCGATTGCS